MKLVRKINKLGRSFKYRTLMKIIGKNFAKSAADFLAQSGGIEGTFEVGRNGLLTVSTKNPNNKGITVSFERQKREQNKRTIKLIITVLLSIIAIRAIARDDDKRQ
jgi:hypothetical protein